VNTPHLLLRLNELIAQKAYLKGEVARLSTSTLLIKQKAEWISKSAENVKSGDELADESSIVSFVHKSDHGSFLINQT